VGQHLSPLNYLIGIMKCNVKGQRALESLEAAFSSYDEQIEKLNKDLESLREELEKTRETVVSVAHEFGMSGNDSQFCNALLFVKKNLSQFQETQEKAREMGYSSLNNLFKAVAMTAVETKNKKTRTYFEEILPKEFAELPLGLQLTNCLADVKTTEKILVESVYPVIEKYLQCENADLSRLFSLWANVSDTDELNYVKNWCVERIYGVKELTPEDLLSMEELTSRSITFSTAYNPQIRQSLLGWVREDNVSVTRRELERDWEWLTPNSIVHKLLKKYAGCPMHSCVTEAVKKLGYLSHSGEWSDEITLEEITAAMKAAEFASETAKWNTDIIDAAVEAIQNCSQGKIEKNSFTLGSTVR
jgi:hypothetical protein